ncbi:GNAT family N-acetyltransferase [Confluentibacter sediminis]|uniref:GNAT family N-acetyltransferase n=1 Tax=Confluentibacter sediminis TaxID=2219045 RepID=UPI000DACA145|nr:GNAT family N-acetyltransferase [Confluentibacter sediminis]
MIKMIPATSKADFESISKLARIIWYEHYPSIISIEQIEYMLKKFNSANAIEEQVADGVLFYNVMFNDEIVGYVGIKQEVDFLFIRKLYLLKAYRGKKIAKGILQFVESKAESYNLKSIRLYVNKYNINSILAYEKMGFVKINAMVTNIGDGFVMDDYEMEKKWND